jgi:preprotein translocase subunit YajC
MKPLIVIAILVALAWVFILVPSRRRQRSHAAMQDDVQAGDEIITAGGIHAIVREAGDEQMTIEIAPGVLVKLDRRDIAAVARDLEKPDPS